jgi:hypothetical protein
MKVTLEKGGALMNWKKVEKRNCLACGAALPNGDLESSLNGSISRCSRCAMVAELISELIQKQVRSGPHLCRETTHAQAT